MNIAIIGAGFSGLAIAWYLLEQARSPLYITIYDSKGIGAGASGIAVGLLHPYAGAHAKLNRMGIEGVEATKELIDISQKTLQQPVALQKGILRIAVNEEQRLDFLQCANKYSNDIKWLDSAACHTLYPQLVEAPGIWIQNGMIVNSPLYLMGLWNACQQRGVNLEIRKINSLKEFKNCDAVILTSGAEIIDFPQISSYSLSIVKGQILELEWPKRLPPLPFALNSQAYVVMNEDGSKCLAGATFERGYKSIEPDVDVAKNEILPKVVAMIPALEDAKIVGCYSGLRVVTKNHLPLAERIEMNTWVLTGMGSKGLLYHALYAKKLAFQILEKKNE
ncbi:MAG: FAD-binding oxidoreductase [Parachlamydiaceae bacterium]|nr:FAD-binding oxidoreductase [Parachlamydiaceae bacterium]